jgi:hypothetical protein
MCDRPPSASAIPSLRRQWGNQVTNDTLTVAGSAPAAPAPSITSVCSTRTVAAVPPWVVAETPNVPVGAGRGPPRLDAVDVSGRTRPPWALVAAAALALLAVAVVVVVLVGRDDERAVPPEAPTTTEPRTTTEPPTTTTEPPTTTTTVLEPPDRLWLRFDAVGELAFERDDEVIAAIESTNAVDLDNIFSSSELAVVDEEGFAALRQRYVPSQTGSPVVEFIARFEPADELWLSYRVYFEPGWEWVLGGKLPGLGGGTRPTGGGGGDGDDGFSARLMWRRDGRLVVYAYHPDRPGRFGEDFPLDGRAPVGRWFTVTQRLRMNSGPERYDGLVEVWIDGERRLSRTGLRWRVDGDFGIDQLAYSSFYGGSDPSWAPSTTTYARFAEFRVHSGAEGVERASPPQEGDSNPPGP